MSINGWTSNEFGDEVYAHESDDLIESKMIAFIWLNSFLSSLAFNVRIPESTRTHTHTHIRTRIANELARTTQQTNKNTKICRFTPMDLHHSPLCHRTICILSRILMHTTHLYIWKRISLSRSVYVRNINVEYVCNIPLNFYYNSKQSRWWTWFSMSLPLSSFFVCFLSPCVCVCVRIFSLFARFGVILSS